MDDDVARNLADWITEVSRRQGAMEIAFRRLVDEVEALSPGATDRVYATVRAPPGTNPATFDVLNALIADIRGET